MKEHICERYYKYNWTWIAEGIQRNWIKQTKVLQCGLVNHIEDTKDISPEHALLMTWD